jgi:hypothetical protein
LANDEVIDAGVAFGADNSDYLAAAGVERIRVPRGDQGGSSSAIRMKCNAAGAPGRAQARAKEASGNGAIPEDFSRDRTVWPSRPTG